MKILFITNDLLAGNLAHLLVQEGHDVRLFVEEKDRRDNFSHMVEKTKNWKKDLSWVGKDGLIVFDDVGYGKIQDKLRKKGYLVFGGTELSDKLELDREYGQAIFKECGMQTVELRDFDNMDDAIMFVKSNPKRWVIKQNSHASKSLNYVGHFEDGRDVVGVLGNYLQNKKINQEKITLHERLFGVEIGVGRYFNGSDWVGPIEYNIEHKKFFPGDIGPTTSEMGTLAWLDDDEEAVLYKKTIALFKDHLRKINFRGDFEINCIVNETGVYPLEATPRFGSPIVHLHSELFLSPWGEILSSIAKGESYNFKWKKEYGIVVVLALPPFPYTKKIKDNIFYGTNVYFDDVTEDDFRHIHFEEISKRPGNTKVQHYISDTRGYVMYVTGTGETISLARENTYSLINKIIIPNKMYRNDIGDKFDIYSKDLLKKWGYL